MKFNFNYIKSEQIWKVIPGTDNIYSASIYGDIKNNITNRLLKQFVVGNYKKISIYVNKVYKQEFVHKLVAKAFLDNPNNYPHVDHIDTDCLNNNINNLRWCTTKMNNNNPITITKQLNRLRSYNNERKIKISKYDNNKNLVNIYESVISAAKSVNDASTNISRVCKANKKLNDLQYKVKGYYFIYLNE